MAELQDLLPYTSKLRLIYIESDVALRDKVTPFLQKVFIHVDTANDGYEGLNYYKVNHHEIVLMNNDVPNMKGELLLTNIKTFYPEQKVIITGKAFEKEELLAYVKGGVENILNKPFVLSELLDAILSAAMGIYQKSQYQDAVARIKALKEKQSVVYNEMDAKEQKLNEQIAYERKRIGRLLQQQKAQEKEIATLQEEAKRAKSGSTIEGVRSKFELMQTLSQSKERAMLYLGVDHFDAFNTIFGLHSADKFLAQIAQKIQTFLPTNTTLYHMGHAAFALLIDEPSPQQESLLAEQIQSLFQTAALSIDTIYVTLTFSIGVAIESTAIITTKAYLAFKESQRNGGNCMRTFSSQSPFFLESRRELLWLKTIKEALAQKSISNLYQNVFKDDLTSTEFFDVITHVKDAQGRLINVKKLSPSILGASLQLQLSWESIVLACDYFASNSYKFSIYISFTELAQEAFVKKLLAQLTESRVAPNRLLIEFDFSALLIQVPAVTKSIKMLQENGVRFIMNSIMLHESLIETIQTFSIERVKFDAALFTQSLESEVGSKNLKLIYNMMHSLGVSVIASDIDTKQLHDASQQLKPAAVTGSFIAKPSATAKITA